MIGTVRSVNPNIKSAGQTFAMMFAGQTLFNVCADLQWNCS